MSTATTLLKFLMPEIIPRAAPKNYIYSCRKYIKYEQENANFAL